MTIQNTKPIEFKRGATFSLKCTWKVNNVATPITGIDFASQIRRPTGELIADLRVIPDPDNNALKETESNNGNA